MGKLLVPLETYLSSGIRIGSKFKTKYMEEFIYKIRPDGLALFNANKIDERLRIAVKFLSRYEPEDIMVVCRRENGINAVRMLGKVTGMNAVPGRYLPGTLTNTSYTFYKEAKVLFACDPWVDRNAIEDAVKVNIPVVAICDTNNTPNNVDLVIPGNNKGRKALATMLWIIAREFLKAKGKIKSDKEFPYKVEEFMGE
ncbi:30S ribosomal protein S2 [Nanoarchaeota archaeon]|nr:30S ribosomal protein S2 [Nanoarchaeota archaeon]RLG16874.1 MAG: 30S ribosomal protein S2 [Nanoarchaeota archaeon]